MQLHLPHQEERKERGEEARTVHRKTSRYADHADQDAADCGTNDARAVEHCRVEGNGTPHLFAWNHLREERLSNRHVDRVDCS